MMTVEEVFVAIENRRRVLDERLAVLRLELRRINKQIYHYEYDRKRRAHKKAPNERHPVDGRP